MIRRACFILALAFFVGACGTNKKESIYIYAAISTSSVLNEFEQRFETSNPQLDLKINYAATSTLARQIDAGAPADLFISADTLWTLFLKERKFSNEASIQIANNSLVVVSKIRGGTSAYEVIEESSKLSVAELEHVPAGRHAKNILQCLDLYPAVAHKLVPSMNVRVAFLNVKNKILDTGIVYRSEAMNASEFELEVYEIDEACSQAATYELMILTKGKRRSMTEEVVKSIQSLPNRRLWEDKVFH